MSSEMDLLARFPKRRSELPESYRTIYVDHYRQNRDGGTPATSVSKRMESWMHRKAAADTATRAPGYSTLEIGSGTLNHIQYEPSSATYDVVEPFVELFAHSPFRSRVRQAFASLDEVEGKRYDRIVSIAAFEHLCDLPATVARCGVLLNPGGQLRAAIPSEGTILWTLGWKLTTGLEFRLKRGLDYGVLMRHEHVNTSEEIASVLRVFFRSIRRSVFGISPALSFYQFFECANPNVARCEDYLSNLDLTR